MTDQPTAPTPDLRIVPTDRLHPHEEHDSQRAVPLVERLRHEATVINPPIVASINDDDFVILDGANRCYAFAKLNYPHSLVQVASYDDGAVELSTWQHVVGGWNERDLLLGFRQIPGVEIDDGREPDAIAHALTRSGSVFALLAPLATDHERNRILQHVVRVYQQNAALHRTVAAEPSEIWGQFPNAIAVVTFPHYAPADIIAAARYRAYLPPGISRHIVHGRAIRVNYPIDALRDPGKSLAVKNAELQGWIREKLANRQVRYYAESTYQFDE